MKQYKVPLIIGGIILLSIFILVITRGKLPSPPAPPFGITEEGEVIPPEKRLDLVSETPPSGQPRYNVQLSEEIKFTFSKPIKPETAKVVVRPYVSLKTYVLEDPNALYVVPFEDAWKPNTEHLITITELEGIHGEKLTTAVKYTYYNSSLEEVDWEKEQITLDYLYIEEQKEKAERYPWLDKLPVDNSEYVIVYDFDAEEFRIRLKVPSSAPEDQKQTLLNKALNQLKSITGEQDSRYYVLFIDS